VHENKSVSDKVTAATPFHITARSGGGSKWYARQTSKHLRGGVVLRAQVVCPVLVIVQCLSVAVRNALLDFAEHTFDVQHVVPEREKPSLELGERVYFFPWTAVGSNIYSAAQTSAKDGTRTVLAVVHSARHDGALHAAHDGFSRAAERGRCAPLGKVKLA
jgi:hypothetical protein